ncbi:MAG TPA: hypothetical protein VGA77_09640, partial [Propylenella sp.]
MWSDETVLVIATGPSLSLPDLAIAHDWRRDRERTKVISVNDAYRYTSGWQDLIYACDLKWWKLHYTRTRMAHCLTIDDSVPYPIHVLRNSGIDGFDPDPSAIRSGGNSAYQAVHIAAHAAARRIVMLGVDYRPGERGMSHCFGDHPPGLQTNPPWKEFIGTFAT